MTLFALILGYFMGAIPTAYIAGRLLFGRDIREMGDGNMGAQNAFRQLSPKVGVAVGVIDAAKGAVAVMLAQWSGLSQFGVMAAGITAIAGHNWPVFIGFRGGRGEASTIGIFLVLLTQPFLIVAGPAALVLWWKKNVTLASAVLFVSLPLACWWLRLPWVLIFYSMSLPAMVGLTHLLRLRQSQAVAARQA